jgi:hypothetical protein
LQGDKSREILEEPVKVTYDPEVDVAGWRRPPSFGVCDFPKGPVGDRGNGFTALPKVPLRGIAGSKNHLLKIKGIAQIGERAGHRDRFS